MKLRDLNRFLICFTMANDAVMRDDARYAVDSALADLRAALDAVSRETAMPIASPVPFSFFAACREQVRAWLDCGDDMRVEIVGVVAGSMSTLARWQDGRLQEQVERRLQTTRIVGG